MIEPMELRLDGAAPLAVTPDRNVAVAVLVAEDGRYLLQLRDDKPGLHLAGHWALFGGALEPGEAAADGLRRELLEELGFAAGVVAPLAVSIHAVAPALAVFRMHFFTVPFGFADLDRMVQTEGAGKALFTIAEACALDRISPWDLAALLFHARGPCLFPAPQGD
jgi:8-oxo-dGTP pyrophosphatase MutT (NUDIX family)